MSYQFAKYLVSQGKPVGDALNLVKSSMDPYGMWMNWLVFNVYGDPSVGVTSSGEGPTKQVVFAVNAGGAAYTGSDGVAYAADKNFTGGTTAVVTSAISGTSDAALYQSERWGASSYSIPNLASGKYEIVFKFAETYWTSANARKFDVVAEGQTVISQLDVFAAAGGMNKAYDVTKFVDVTDGTLNISFTNASVDQPKICAFVVYGTSSENKPPVANAGADLTARKGIALTLDGSLSSDPDNGPQALKYNWRQVSGPSTIYIQNPALKAVSVTLDAVGTYEFELAVNDGLATSTDRVQVIVENTPPVAYAGPDQTVSPNAKVTLDGSGSSDPDQGPQNPMSFSWTQVNGATATGTYTFRLTVSDGAISRSDDVVITVQTSTYITLPGRVQAEAYNAGGEGVGYHDLTAGNTGGQFRTDNVDIEACTDAGTGYNVGWIDASEWLAYDVTVPTGMEGTYRLTARVASYSAGTKSLTVSFSGPKGSVEKTLSFTHADGWQTWHDVSVDIAMLPGNQQMKIVATTGNFNLNYIEIAKGANQPPVANAGVDQSVSPNTKVTLDGRGSADPDNGPQPLTYSWAQTGGTTVTLTGTQTAQPSFTPTAAGSYTFKLTVSDGISGASDDVVITVKGNDIPLPGRIQAEDYRTGGEGLAYHDLTAGNTGGQFRTDNVDIEACTDVGGGYNVGWIDAGEWLSYMVNVSQSGNYTFTARVASGTAGTKQLTVTVDGVMVGNTMSFTAANGWQGWTDVSMNNVALTAGQHELRIQMTTANFNINYLDVTQQTVQNLITNGDFANGLTSWEPVWISPAAGSAINDGQAAKMVIDAAGVNPWDIQLFQSSAIFKDKTYQLEFYVKSETIGKNFKVVIEHNGDPWTKYVEQQFQFTQAANTWQKFTVQFYAPVNDYSVKIGFHFGATGLADAWLDNVKMTSN
jgi:hypothetical protein